MNEAINRILYKAKKNELLDITDIENLINNDQQFDSNNTLRFVYSQSLIKKALLTRDFRGFNPLDWAIVHHNYKNIQFLLEYIDPNQCTKNCFERLLRGVIGTPNQNNITNITILLLKYKCSIPDNLDSKENSPRMRDLSAEAKKILENTRLSIAAVENADFDTAAKQNNLPYLHSKK